MKRFLVFISIFMVFILTACDQFGVDDAVELSEEYCRDNPTAEICQGDLLEAVDKAVVETTLKSFLTSFNEYDNQEQYCEEYISVTNLDLLDACKEDIDTILPPDLNDFEIEEITTDLLNMKSVVEITTEENTYFFDVQFTEEDGNILIAEWSYRTLDTEMNNDETPPTFDYINDVYLSKDVTSYDWQSLVKNASDDVSSDVTIYIEENTVDFGTLGEYKVTISVSDEAGNKATQTVPVIISEDTANLPPVIEEGKTSVKLGSTAEEFPYLDYFEIKDPDGDELTYEVIKDEIEYGTIGTYDFVFSATDTAGNELTIDVEVEVFDNDVPTFDTVEDQLLSVDVTSYDWTTLLTNLTDRNSDDLTVEVIESNVIFGEVGTYQVTLLVADEFGNEVEESFSVQIYASSTDLEAPTFDTISDQEIDVSVSSVSWEDYIMNLSDNTDTIDNLSITVDDGVNYETVGTYTVTIKVSDSSGNTTTESFDVSVVDHIDIDTLFTSYLDEYIDSTIDSEVLCEKYYDAFDLTTCIAQRDQLLDQSISYLPADIVYEEASNGYYVEFNLIINNEPLDPITLNVIPVKEEGTWQLTIQTSIDLRPLNLDEAYAAYQEFLTDYLDKDLTVSELLYLYFEEDSDTDLSEEFQYREEFLSLETTFRDLIITPVNSDNMSPFIIEVTRNTGGEDIPLTFIGDLYKTRDGRYVFDITYQTTVSLADYQDFMVYFVNQFNNLDTSQAEVCDTFFDTSQWCMDLTKPTSDNDAFLSLTEFFEHAQGYTAIFTHRTSQGYEKFMYDVEFTILDETMEMNLVEPAYNWVYESMEDVWAYLDQFSQAFNDTSITHSDFCETYVTDTIYEDCEQYRTEKHANNEQLMDQSIEIALTGYVASLTYSDDAGNTYTEEIDIWFEVEENNLLATFYVLEQQTTPDDITYDEAQQTIIDKVNAFNNSTISDTEFCENNSDLFSDCYALREAMTDSGWIELNAFEFIEDENGSYYKTTFDIYFSETESAHTIIGKYTFNYDNNQEIVITTMHVTSAFSYNSFTDAKPVFTDFINDYLIYELESDVLVDRYNILVDPVWLFARGTIVESGLSLVDIVFEDNVSYPEENLYATVTFTDNTNTYTMNYEFKVRTDINEEITIEFTELDPPIIPQYFANVFIESVLIRAYYDDEETYCADYVEETYTTECQTFRNHLLEYELAELATLTYDEIDLTYTAEVNLIGSMGTTSATETYIFTIYYDEDSNPRIILDRWQQ